MTITITKWKLGLAILAVAMLAPATAIATHVFDDVDHSRFYAEPVEWAFNNNITTGKSPTIFDPEGDVTRGESVTFLKRYDDNIVQPAIDALYTKAEVDAAIAAATQDLFDSDSFASDFTTTSTTATDVGLSATVTIPSGMTGIIETTFSAESACYNGDGGGEWCRVDLLVDGTALTPAGSNTFDGTDGGTDTLDSTAFHSITRTSDNLAAGTYTVTVEAFTTATDFTFYLDDAQLVAQVHLTST